MKNAVIVPTYNEVESIERLVRAICGLDADIRVIVVDDASPDGTGQVADRVAAELPHAVTVIHRPAKAGLGTAHMDGMREALRDPAVERVLTMDADFSHDPCFIPDLLDGTARGDVVIGSRYIAGGQTLEFAWHRRLISRGANLFARTMLRLPSADNTSGFRCYRREVIETLDLAQVFSPGYSFLVEFLTRCRRAGFVIVETPITYVARAHGLSKISTREMLDSVKTIIELSLGSHRH